MAGGDGNDDLVVIKSMWGKKRKEEFSWYKLALRLADHAANWAGAQ